MADINEFKDLIPLADTMNKVLLVSALHGVGKSTVCTEYAANHDMHFEPLILSLMDVSDLMGMPSVTEIKDLASTTWAAPTWYTRIVNAAWPAQMDFNDLVFNDPAFEAFVKKHLALD